LQDHHLQQDKLQQHEHRHQRHPGMPSTKASQHPGGGCESVEVWGQSDQMLRQSQWLMSYYHGAVAAPAADKWTVMQWHLPHCWHAKPQCPQQCHHETILTLEGNGVVKQHFRT
jgi:hypothetical protein